MNLCNIIKPKCLAPSMLFIVSIPCVSSSSKELVKPPGNTDLPSLSDVITYNCRILRSVPSDSRGEIGPLSSTELELLSKSSTRESSSAAFTLTEAPPLNSQVSSLVDRGSENKESAPDAVRCGFEVISWSLRMLGIGYSLDYAQRSLIENSRLRTSTTSASTYLGLSTKQINIVELQLQDRQELDDC